MCGVIGLIFENRVANLGQIAAELLKMLEYRGYDSTGAVVQDGDAERIQLAKGVGAPSVMVHKLGINDFAGEIFCGQVRWATFGAVTDENSQPHLVRCMRTLYGAHNGNVTNSDELKGWLRSEGHRVVSDNDGEMVVHTIEHFFSLELLSVSETEQLDPTVRRRSMRTAIRRASERLEGSFAAVIVDPVSKWLWGIKSGSSFYFGFGSHEVHGNFCIASSDLSSVLKLTRVVVPLQEGEFVEYNPKEYHVFSAKDEEAGKIVREPVRSRLRAKDTALIPPFETFMDQEIAAQEDTCHSVIRMFSGGSQASRVLGPYLSALGEKQTELSTLIDPLLDLYDDDAIARTLHTAVDNPLFKELLTSVANETKRQVAAAPIPELADRLASGEAGFFADLLPMARDADDTLAVRFMDVVCERGELDEFSASVDRFAEICTDCLRRGGRIYVVCCGSSFHAAKAACLFFNELACTELIPIIPGEFRGQYSQSLRDGDVFVAVSQSGETKDLIDVLNFIIASGRDIQRVALVNNVNSTVAQEKSHLVIPLRCGPEVAVPATKSFMNQMVVFYCLALRLGEKRLANLPTSKEASLREEIDLRRKKLDEIPLLIRETIDSTDADIERAARILYLAPSIHILATRITAVAKEGALKVREVVLNHTEGFEGSEFKHGPNTILGVNTLYGPASNEAMLKRLGRTIDALLMAVEEQGMPISAVRRLVQATTDSVFSPTSTPFSLTPMDRNVFDMAFRRTEMLEALYTNYPLIYITGPDEQDVNLTVSQINTHKIRGASTVVVAEEHPALRGAATKVPTDSTGYESVFITLPRTNDMLMTVFSSTVVLQRLALKMSQLKAWHLDRLGLKNHGVHPDVPKNVSKSITVD